MVPTRSSFIQKGEISPGDCGHLLVESKWDVSFMRGWDAEGCQLGDESMGKVSRAVSEQQPIAKMKSLIIDAISVMVWCSHLPDESAGRKMQQNEAFPYRIKAHGSPNTNANKHIR